MQTECTITIKEAFDGHGIAMDQINKNTKAVFVVHYPPSEPASLGHKSSYAVTERNQLLFPILTQLKIGDIVHISATASVVGTATSDDYMDQPDAG